ncbi:adhesion G protein-coupled receptor E5-like [Haliotis rubra]|uniref:adhesion G protein-coupled receptor E5-like n=1 Tax=Haliotis rubra TaxID=36100 RepID=UPI001EE625B8|nr:adhesion G protein-coupled receptor E5-like [Haliotis rubra]
MLYSVQNELHDYVWVRTSQQLYHLQNCDSHPRFLIVHIYTQMFSTTPSSLENLMTSLPDILTKHISDEKYGHGNVSLTLNQKCAQMILPTLNCFDEGVHDKRMNAARLTNSAAYISSQIEYIPWNNQALCPQVLLQQHEFFLELDGDKQDVTNVLFPNVSLHSPLPLNKVDPYMQEFYVLRINGTDSIFKSEMFLLGDNDTAVVCLDDYQKLVKRAPLVTPEYIDWPLGRTSVVCTCVSLLFLIITFVFYCAYPTLRTSGGVINMCLIVTLFLTLCVYEFGMEQNENETVCVIIGIFIHFFWLSVLCWMNACTTHMFLKLSFPLRWRRSESLERTLLFWSLFSFLTPVAIVGINITVHYSLDREFGYGGKVCYLNTVSGRIYSFGVPVAVVSLLNIFLFIFTMCKLKRKFEPVQKSSNSKLNMVACVKLSTITGISWLFGYLYELTQTRVLAYVFTILVAGQGVFLFLAFIVNKKTLGLVCSKKRGSSKYTSSSNSNNNNNSKSGPLTTQTSRL